MYLALVWFFSYAKRWKKCRIPYIASTTLKPLLITSMSRIISRPSNRFMTIVQCVRRALILPRHKNSMENPARYIIRASFSQERMTHQRETGQVVYRSKGGVTTKTFDALECLAAMCSHMPNKGEQMVRYYGYYSNVARGKRKKAAEDDNIPCVLEPELSDREFRKNWARLIQKIYEVDPLVCPKCSGEMRIIAFIEDPALIKKILKHLGLWHIKRKPRPVAHGPPDSAFPAYDEQPAPSADAYIIDPEYPVEAYFQKIPSDLSGFLCLKNVPTS